MKIFSIFYLLSGLSHGMSLTITDQGQNLWSSDYEETLKYLEEQVEANKKALEAALEVIEEHRKDTVANNTLFEGLFHDIIDLIKVLHD